MREYLLNPKKDKEAANNKDSNNEEGGGNHLFKIGRGPKASASTIGRSRET